MTSLSFLDDALVWRAWMSTLPSSVEAALNAGPAGPESLADEPLQRVEPAYRSEKPSTAETASTSDTARLADLQFRLLQAMRVGVPAEQFYRAFVGTLVEACTARAVCVWQVRDGAIAPAFHSGLDAVGLIPGTPAWAQHDALAVAVIRRNAFAAIPPLAQTDVGMNPIAAELLLAPVMLGKQIIALIEVIGGGAGSAANGKEATGVDANASGSRVASGQQSHPEPGALRQQIVRTWAGMFTEHAQTRDALSRAGQADAEATLRTMITRLHSASTIEEVAVIAANECRGVFGCDRVSLGWLRRGRVELLAVSGQDRIDSRSPVVKTLTALAQESIRSGATFRTNLPIADEEASSGNPLSGGNRPGLSGVATSHGKSPVQLPVSSTSRADSAARYKLLLKDYPTDQQPKSLVILPVLGSSNDTKPTVSPQGAVQKSFGVLILEQFRGDTVPMIPAPLVELVGEQLRVALQRAEILAAVPMLSVWERRANVKRRRGGVRIWWALACIAAVVGVGSIPLELRTPATGTLHAEARRIVFAPEDGIVREVFVKHGATVKPGQPLFRLENLELVSLRRELAGQMQQSVERRRAVEARRTSNQSTEREQLESQGLLLEIDAAIQSLERQIELVQQRLDRLNVVATEAGLITTANPEQWLLNRPCHQGEPLIQQIDPDGAWRLDILISETDSGHVVRRMAEVGRDAMIPVDFVLATESDHRYHGQLREIAPITEPTPAGTVLRAVVDLAPDALPPLRDGAAVTARISCGKRKAAFIWLREPIEVLQRNWWY